MPETFGEIFARRLRQEREERGLTQGVLAQLTELLGEQARVDRLAINKIENGKRRAEVGEAYALATALGLALDDLLRERNAKAYIASQVSTMEARLRDLLKQLHDLEGGKKNDG